MQINKFRLAIAILVVLSVGFFIYSTQSKITANAVKIQEEQKFLNEWLPENCNCLEKERVKCADGFELFGNTCRNKSENTFTNVLKSCSKYDCSGVVYNFGNETEKWEKHE